MSDKTLVTGATGLIGFNIVKSLLQKGRQVRALVRSLDRGRSILPEGCELARGDVTDPASIESAIQNCSAVYHAAGLPEQWLADNDVFRQVNVEGTRHLVEAALEQKVKRFVYTSTIDVFQAGRGEEYDESIIDPDDKGTYYERSKQEADRIVTAALDRGLPAVFLHPSGLYGPGPEGSPGLNQLIIDFAKGDLPALLPGGFPVVYSEDVAAGHLLAEAKAPVGGRYILSDAYFSLKEMAAKFGRELNIKKTPPVIPVWAGKLIAVLGEEVYSRLTRKPPLIPRGQLTFLQWQARPRSARAQKELGWNPVPFEEGLKRTIAFLREAGRM